MAVLSSVKWPASYLPSIALPTRLRTEAPIRFTGGLVLDVRITPAQELHGIPSKICMPRISSLLFISCIRVPDLWDVSRCTDFKIIAVLSNKLSAEALKHFELWWQCKTFLSSFINNTIVVCIVSTRHIMLNFYSDSATQSLDTVIIREIRAEASVGPDRWGKERNQPVLISVLAHTPLTKAGLSDDVRDSIHYGDLGKRRSRERNPRPGWGHTFPLIIRTSRTRRIDHAREGCRFCGGGSGSSQSIPLPLAACPWR